MDPKTIIAKWIKEARTAAELSGADLGAKLALEMRLEKGITRANVSHWETEKHSPNLQQVLGIVKITGTGVPAPIISAMQGRGAVRPVMGTASTLERLDADEWALIQLYRGSTPGGKDLIRKLAKTTDKDESSDSFRRSDKG